MGEFLETLMNANSILNDLNRRRFLKTLAAVSVSTLVPGCGGKSEPTSAKIMTVLGPVAAKDLGKTLPHEHIMVDFVGADQTGSHRWDDQEVVETMLPYLQAIRDQGVQAFFDCTPAYLGRDVGILARLSRATGMHIITNTGFYKEPYLPQRVFDRDAHAIAAEWIAEWQHGIDGTPVKPGFIKIAVHRELLKPTQEKIVRAACRTHNATGLAIACHTGHGPAALQMLDILQEEGTPANALIVVHANSEKDVTFHEKIAARGAWVEYDNIGSWEPQKHIELIQRMLDKGYKDRLLLSMDRGWYRVGEPGGGEVKPYTYLFGEFVQKMASAGINRDIIQTLTVDNPARAFAINKT
jgi:phosphotriesterase-related protein